MTSEEKEISSSSKVLLGIPLAKRFYEIALEEFASGSRERQKNGCEKGFRAATEAIDTLISSKGIQISVGKREAHFERRRALITLEDLDPTIRKIGQIYAEFTDDLHGDCFYSNVDPKIYGKRLHQVQEFIDLIEEML